MQHNVIGIVLHPFLFRSISFYALHQLEHHVHEGRIEIHEVIAGSGEFYLYSKEVAYTQGTISVIPANAPHKLFAGKEGIYLFAKFTPALQ